MTAHDTTRASGNEVDDVPSDDHERREIDATATMARVISSPDNRGFSVSVGTYTGPSAGVSLEQGNEYTEIEAILTPANARELANQLVEAADKLEGEE